MFKFGKEKGYNIPYNVKNISKGDFLLIYDYGEIYSYYKGKKPGTSELEILDVGQTTLVVRDILGNKFALMKDKIEHGVFQGENDIVYPKNLKIVIYGIRKSK